jgi:hypothetical protein
MKTDYVGDGDQVKHGNTLFKDRPILEVRITSLKITVVNASEEVRSALFQYDLDIGVARG